ncbi:unnamed protein product [Chondrus crispus]|uniref:Uncharacterized protein n=1 Tax=Chondrus crispus TaxID=2769 RepID=R7Q4T0_CHOCR|nr:unnamed protein product [Chondrus crispus]CDF32999.1 unnamed protein product [Chondrus crispus]|eukprot:XP_005712802.1 unnamed protein product [Chondrus crispus]
MDQWLLLAKDGDPALFYVPSSITGLNVTPAGAVQQRKPNTIHDEYSVRVRIEDENVLEETKEGFDVAIEKLKHTPDVCASIAIASGLVEKKSSFSLEETDVVIKVSNFVRDTLYFNRKVAGLHDPSTNVEQAPDFFSVYPKQGKQYPQLLFPVRCHLNPMIPVVGNDSLPISPDAIHLLCQGSVYFELKQSAYSFEGVNGRVKQIVLVPSIVAVRVEPPLRRAPTPASIAKRRILSF